jgi:hypothetical protein
MFLKITLAVAGLLSAHTSSLARAEADQREFWDWLVPQAREIDLEQASSQRAISVKLTIAKGCRVTGQDQLAAKYFDRASAIDAEDKERSHHFALFEYAEDTQQLELAEKIARESGSDTLLDKWDLERFRQGNSDAIKDYPRELTFYSAMDLARELIELGQYDRVAEFVTSIKSLPSNEPEDVIGLAFRDIARRCRDQGDVERAKQYIDKAVAAAGNQFYTGYSIQITHRSIHGELTKDLEKFAQRGAAYPAHMGGELIRILAAELVRTGHYEEAKMTTSLLKKPEDRVRSLRAVATHQARCGDLVAALKTVEQFEDVRTRNAVRLSIARVLCDAGKAQPAEKLADYVLRATLAEQEIDEERSRDYKNLSQVYGKLCSRPQLEQIFAQAKTPQLRDDCVWYAVRGFAELLHEESGK